MSQIMMPLLNLSCSRSWCTCWICDAPDHDASAKFVKSQIMMLLLDLWCPRSRCPCWICDDPDHDAPAGFVMPLLNLWCPCWICDAPAAFVMPLLNLWCPRSRCPCWICDAPDHDALLNFHYRCWSTASIFIIMFASSTIYDRKPHTDICIGVFLLKEKTLLVKKPLLVTIKISPVQINNGFMTWIKLHIGLQNISLPKELPQRFHKQFQFTIVVFIHQVEVSLSRFIYKQLFVGSPVDVIIQKWILNGANLSRKLINWYYVPLNQWFQPTTDQSI